MSPRTGRPKVENPKDVRFSIRMDIRTFENLKKYCDKQSITVAEGIRIALNQLLEQK